MGVVRRAWKRPAARRIWFVIVLVLEDLRYVSLRTTV